MEPVMIKKNPSPSSSCEGNISNYFFFFFKKNKRQIRAIQVINHLDQMGVGSMLMISIIGYFLSVSPGLFSSLTGHLTQSIN